MKTILLDIGSSTIKAYEKEGTKLKHLFNRSIKFKEGFSPESGVTPENKKELYEVVDSLKKKNNKVKIYATSVFRDLDREVQVRFVDEFFNRTGLFFNIISQELESFYLQKALVGKYETNKPVLLINIGGGSTELVVMSGNEAIEQVNLKFGVGSLIQKYPGINNEFSDIDLNEIVSELKEELPALENKVNLAFYSGGELTYMKLAGYKLTKNSIFADKDHPLVISTSDFQMKNRDIFSKITLQELEELMPANPTWMHGARVCSAIAQAICERYRIKDIVPSDSNLINGVVRQEFRYITLSGSFRKHLSEIVKVKNELEERGVKILSPRFTEPKNPKEEFVVFQGEEGLTPLELERYHLQSIEQSDALVVCDPQGYVGASALIEIGYALSINKRVIFIERPEEFMLNTLPHEIGL